MMSIPCDNCKTRYRMARIFDLHWFGKDDCPFCCPVIVPESMEKEDDKNEQKPMLL